jgi:phosphopantothenate---cysteine ligase (CTP)
MRILITSGGTKIPIDMVRNITNMSNGTFGSRIAYEALRRDHQVHFLHAKRSLTPFTIQEDIFMLPSSCRDYRDRLEQLQWTNNKYGHNYSQSGFNTFDEYAKELETLMKREYDAVILAAAVSDYTVDNYVDGKIRTGKGLEIKMKPLPKLISKIKEWNPNIKLVGFKLLVNSTEKELTLAAKKSIVDNKCDLVVANDLRDIKLNDHQLLLVKESSVRKVHVDYDDNYYLARQVIKELEEL